MEGTRRVAGRGPPFRSSREPAVDGAECGEACGVLGCVLEGGDPGESGGAALVDGLDGDDDVTSSEEIDDLRALEGEARAGDGEFRGVEYGAGTAGHGVEVAGFAVERLVEPAEADAAGGVVVGAGRLEGVEDEEPAGIPRRFPCGGRASTRTAPGENSRPVRRRTSWTMGVIAIGLAVPSPSTRTAWTRRIPSSRTSAVRTPGIFSRAAAVRRSI